MAKDSETQEFLRRRFRKFNPLMTRSSIPALKRLLRNPDAPRWNHPAGDRITADDAKFAEEFRFKILNRKAWGTGIFPDWLEGWLSERAKTVPWFRRVLPDDSDITKSWYSIPTSSRELIAQRPEELVPDDVDLKRMVVYRTSGTSGHALLVPHHPRAAGAYLVFIEAALRQHGIIPQFKSGEIACVLIGAQAHTVTYATTLSLWGEGGFAKINLSSSEWPKPQSSKRYLEALNPMILTGDPISFAELLKVGPEIKPSACISTAVAMSPSLKAAIKKHFACPVIEWYSLTETGPIGYSCSFDNTYHLLAPDLFVEVLDSEGNPVPSGVCGEITVTGGRNPFVPLLRYRTGDWGRLSYEPCSCGDPMPQILDLEGRKPVLLASLNGGLVNPVDVSRVLRDFPLLQHEFRQKADLSCFLKLRLVPGHEEKELDEIPARLKTLFGENLNIKIQVDEELGNRNCGSKIIPYSSEILLED